MHKTAGARDNMNSIYARTCTRVHRFDMTRARMCDIWLAACVLRWGGNSFQAHVRAHRSVRSRGCAIAAGTRYTQSGHVGT